MHWSAGTFANFPCYTIGNIMSAQVFAAAHSHLPDLAGKLAQGDYGNLLNWLTEAIYQHGRAYSTDELLVRISGEGLNVAPLLHYLERKYSDLYGLNGPTKDNLDDKASCPTKTRAARSTNVSKTCSRVCRWKKKPA